MGKQYVSKRNTGREYVDAAKEFHAYTLHMILKLPEKWKDFFLIPICQASGQIESSVIDANAVYVDRPWMTEEEKIRQYIIRIECLGDALRCFDVFDRKLECMMDQVDIMKDESRRLRKIICNIIQEEAKKEKLDASVLKPEMHLDEIVYTTSAGKRTMRLGITNKHLDRWMSLEIKAKEEIQKRLSADRKIVNALQTKKEANTNRQ